jgi:branched-chain amino acid transport system permease protein
MRELILGNTRRSSAVRSTFVLVLVTVALLLSFASFGRYTITITTTLLLFMAAASAFNIIGGVAGQFSLASSAMIGVGSYITVMMLRGVETPLPVILVAAGLGGAVFAAAVGLILFRLRGFYFTIGTLAVALGAMTWMTTWEFTGATTGISAPLALIPDGKTQFLLALTIAVLAIGASIAIINSSFGLRLMAVRDDEDIADSLGVPPFRMKMLAIMISGAITAVAGGLFAVQKSSVEPFSSFALTWSITIIVMAIVGGLGSTWGPALGAIVIYYGVTVQLESLPALGSLLAGALLILVIRFLPGGLVGALGSLYHFVIGRLVKRPANAEASDPVSH